VALEELFPRPRPLELAEAYGDLGLVDLAPAERPYVVACMVSSADGRATLEGGTAALASETDRALFLGLRAQVDAVMAGTRTIAVEGYGPLARSPERRQQRTSLGLEPVPLAVTATRSMRLPLETPLFQDGSSRIAVLTNSDEEPGPSPSRLTVERLPGPELDLAAGMERLRIAHGVRAVLLEGGPTLLAAMLAAGVVDELFLTVAPILAARPSGLALTEGPQPSKPLRLKLRSALKDGDHLFLRYAIEGE
jgi:riboflavin biosynthesis pyrimidine reductase